MSFNTEYFEYVDRQGGVTASQLAEKFSIPIESARSVLSKMVRSGRLWVQRGDRHNWNYKDITESIYRSTPRKGGESDYIDGRDKESGYEKPVTRVPLSPGHQVNVMYIQYVSHVGLVTPSQLATKFSVTTEVARSWLSENTRLGRLHCVRGNKSRTGHVPEENKYGIASGEAADKVAWALV
jgi:ribosomal protein S25